MHMHVRIESETDMRTTIEIRDEHRARLLEIAARRGEKGFSTVVTEAIQLFLEAQIDLDKARRRALDARGSLGEREASELREETLRIRANWR
jgi:predicted transcriptional regulator